MKKRTIKIMLLLSLVIILLMGMTGIHKQIAIDIIEGQVIYNDYASKLQKYEIVFIYPKGQENEIEKIKSELRQIYNLAQDKLIVSYVEYDKEDCKNSIIADIDLKGDVSYRSILFVYTNSDMCKSIQWAMQNTTSSVSKHKKGFARQKIITIPIDENSKESMEKWNKEREDWFNYKNTNNTDGAIKEMYNTLNITEEEVQEANNRTDDSEITVEDIEIPENNEEIDNEIIMEYKNSDIRIKHQVQDVQVVLANGMIVKPNEIDKVEKIKNVGLNNSEIHGAKVYIQYLISIERVNTSEKVRYGEITLKCKNDNLTFDETTQLLDTNTTNKEEGWKKDKDEFTNTLKVGKSKRIVGYQVITNGMDLIYDNKITNISYQRIATRMLGGVEYERIDNIIIKDIIKSNMVKIEEE